MAAGGRAHPAGLARRHRSAREMQSRGGAPLVKVSIAANRLGGLQHLHVDPPPLELLDHGAGRAELAVRPGAEYELLRELVLNLSEVLDCERVPLAPPPVREDAVGQ